MKKIMTALAGASLLLAILAPSVASAATTKYNPDAWVSQSGSPVAGYGTGCKKPDYNDIGTALNNANRGDVVHICPGVWYEVNYYSSHTDITIEGEGPSKTIIDLEGDGRFISTYETSGGDWWYNSITVRGITVKNGWINANGGAIEGGDVTCINSTFIGNDANNDDGGAIKAYYDYVGTGCKFYDNWANGSGGAVSVGYLAHSTNELYVGNDADAHGAAIAHIGTEGAPLNIVGGTFRDNWADCVGGAVASWEGNLTVSKSTFYGNVANMDNCDSMGGGAIWDSSGSGDTVSLLNNKFLNNQSAYGADGGAYYQQDGNTVEFIVGNLFDHNYAGDDGGAFYTNADGETWMRSNKFVNNYAQDDGSAFVADSCGLVYYDMLGGKWYGPYSGVDSGSNYYGLDQDWQDWC